MTVQQQITIRPPVALMPPWLASAMKYRGLSEIAGAKHNPQILAWLQAVGIKGALLTDETAWCAAAMHGTLADVGIKGTRSPMARSYERYGQPLVIPKLGCLAVYKRPPNPGSGHVAYWITDLGDHDLCYGGNQNNAMSFSLYPRTDWLAYRWPAGVALPP